MKHAIAFATLIAITSPGWAAKPSASKPPSAVVFSGFYPFNAGTPSHTVPIVVPPDGAWLTGTGSYDNMAYPYWDCSHSYSATLTPNANDYTPLFTAGWLPHETCVNQSPVFGCLTCGVKWGGQNSFPSTSMTTSNRPGFVAGGGNVTLVSHNGGGPDDVVVLPVEQFNRDAMESMRVYQSGDEENPAPASQTDIDAAYYIADSADRVTVVPVFEYGADANGIMREFPAGPGVAWSAIWDKGAATSEPEERFAPQGLHGHSILAVPVPKLETGEHTFLIEARLPSGKTYTSAATSVMVYAQNIYITVEGTFAPKKPEDQLPQFVPGAALNGTNLDLRNGPQMIQLNILIGRGSRGTFDVKLTNVSRYPGITMNYPPGATDSDPDIDFGAGDLELIDVPIPKGGAPKVVKLPLYIHDYAASATIEVTMPYRKTTFTTQRRIPLDEDGNQLPDQGWRAVGGITVGATGLTATGDVDAAGGSTGTDAAIVGDGFSNFEEFRGFIAAGGYVRLDPQSKEIFVDLDPAFLLAGPVASPLSALLTLGPRILFLEPDETKSEDELTRLLHRVRGVVNSNRTGVPVGHPRPQRAIRLIQQTLLPPAIYLAGPNIHVPVWQIGYLGATFSDDVLDIDVLNSPGNVGTTETPMRTQFSEVYTRTFTNLAVSTTFTWPEHYDAAGNVVPPCTTANQSGCDVWDTTNHLIIPALQDGVWGILYTVPDPAHDPADHYSLQARRCSDDTAVLGGLTTLEMERLKGLLAAHEMGHAMGMKHLKNFPGDCGDLMFDTEAPHPNRRTMSHYLPQPSGFSSKDQAMIRLWQP
ncbi:MAG: hypothetical protein ACRD2J_03340 [Thermoanaerobaculia bacterium]